MIATQYEKGMNREGKGPFGFFSPNGSLEDYFLQKVLILAYTVAIAYRCVIILAGLRPSNPPHTRGKPLVNPPEGPCGAGIPR